MNEIERGIEQEETGNTELIVWNGAERRSRKLAPEAAHADGDRYLTVADVGQLLGVCERTVYDALRSGRLKGRKFGRVWRTKMEWIDAWGIGNRN
jgi:excisionase family DNA binding protein